MNVDYMERYWLEERRNKKYEEKEYVNYVRNGCFDY